jgi:thioredoxin reductase (NADPH)
LKNEPKSSGIPADYEIAAVGGGPAGLTAALFAARHGRSTILFDPLGMGGAILNTERIEDLPGFPEGIPGFDFGPRLQEQVTTAGATVRPAEVTRIERRGDDWAVATDSEEITAGALIVATGSRPRKLGVAREDELEGKGLSHCASCDGPLFRGRTVAMVGGGDSALLETLELGGHDVQVVLIHDAEAFGGQETYRRRVHESTYVDVRHRTVVEEILGDGSVEGLRIRDVDGGESSTVEVSAVFVHIGRVPNTELLAGVVALDENGRVATDILMRTGLPGLFAVGDIRADSAGQAISAAGDGATAAVAAHRYLAERGLRGGGTG